MRNLNIKVTIPKDRRLAVQLPDDVEPGEATITVHPQQQKTVSSDGTLDWFPTLNVKHWDPETSLRREDMYGDDGR
jgi:hypothetical protein